jgi:hypothetical protein|tara:strand:+ start:15326 stop:15766 length:441 start_codon:yes stop_codon:yes gene_type:complete
MSVEIESLVEIKLKQPDDFLKVKETLTRIGVASKKDRTLYQSCHILHKQSRYYIVHFKELFMLDGKPSNFSENDQARRNTIVNLLAEWDLVEKVSNDNIDEDNIVPINQLKIIAFKKKEEWELVAKYNIGNKKNDDIKPQSTQIIS